MLVHCDGQTEPSSLYETNPVFSCNDSRLHFSLGSATLIDVDVHWPNGLHETFNRISTNQLITVKKGVGRVTNRGWAATNP